MTKMQKTLLDLRAARLEPLWALQAQPHAQHTSRLARKKCYNNEEVKPFAQRQLPRALSHRRWPSMSHCTEVWRPVYGFEKYYEVSNLGRLRRGVIGSPKRRPYELYSKIKPNNSGYLRYDLHVNAKRTQKLLHVMVLEAFVCPCPPGLVANHKDGNKLNNKLDNLEWVTQSENVRHAIRTGLLVCPKGEEVHNARLTEKQIKAIIASNLPYCEIAQKYGISVSAVQKIKSGHLWAHVDRAAVAKLPPLPVRPLRGCLVYEAIKTHNATGITVKEIHEYAVARGYTFSLSNVRQRASTLQALGFTKKHYRISRHARGGLYEAVWTLGPREENGDD